MLNIDRFCFHAAQLMPQRYVHTLMCFFSFIMMSTMSGILGLTITQMVLPILKTRINGTSGIAASIVDEDACPVPDAMLYHSNNTVHDDMVMKLTHTSLLYKNKIYFNKIHRSSTTMIASIGQKSYKGSFLAHILWVRSARNISMP